MLKYYDYAVTFEEFPDEITLAVNISNCPGYCDGCSEPWLLKDIGTELTFEEVDKLIKEHSDITVFGFMGGDNDHHRVEEITRYIHEHYPELKVGMYSGRESFNMDLLNCLDLYKIGRWIQPDMEHPETWKDHTWGPLVWPVSNQLLFEKVELNGESIWVNTTYRFRQKPIGDWSRYIIMNEDE